MEEKINNIENPVLPSETEKVEGFKTRLDQILNTPLAVENINSFANNTLDKLVVLTTEVALSYKEDSQAKETGRELEDKAYSEYNLQNIQGILDKVQEKLEQIVKIREYIKNHSHYAGEVITPPDRVNETPIQSGENYFEKAKNIPRLITLLYILENDFEITLENIVLVEGRVTDNMLRQEPYFRVQIDSIDRIVYVCDEEKNASYDFDTEELRKNEISVDSLDLLTKEERNVLIKKHPGIGIRLIQTVHWRSNMIDLLSEKELLIGGQEINPIQTEPQKNTDSFPGVSVSEFDPWRNFWTDENNRHWGSATMIARRIGVNRWSLFREIEDLDTKK